MTDDNNTAIDAIQIDEDILSHTVSDEALEAAAGTERGDIHNIHTLVAADPRPPLRRTKWSNQSP
jgi:hypothetical protein